MPTSPLHISRIPAAVASLSVARAPATTLNLTRPPAAGHLQVNRAGVSVCRQQKCNQDTIFQTDTIICVQNHIISCQIHISYFQLKLKPSYRCRALFRCLSGNSGMAFSNETEAGMVDASVGLISCSATLARVGKGADAPSPHHPP